MPVYVQLITWTERGSSAVKETVQRARRAREQAQKLGARLREVIWTMGRYDAVAILEAPNDETASRFALWVGARRGPHGDPARLHGRGDRQDRRRHLAGRGGLGDLSARDSGR